MESKITSKTKNIFIESTATDCENNSESKEEEKSYITPNEDVVIACGYNNYCEC